MERRWVELFDKRPRTPSENEEKERIRDELTNAVRLQAKLLFNELAEVGIRIESVWDLVNTSASYPEAIPILIKHLSKPYYYRNKEGIVRALAVKEAKGIANKAVMEEYRRLPKEDPNQPWIFHYRWAFGNTMSVIVTKDDLSDLIEIVLDKRNGESRTGFIAALAKIKSPKVIEVLHKLENDKNQIVAGRAKKILARKAKAQTRARERKVGKQTMSSDLNELKEEMSGLAVQIANGFGIELDYSVESIRQVEKILGDIHKEYKKTKDEEGLNGIALEFAAYIVKVIEKNIGPVRWERDHPEVGADSFPLYLGDGAIFPFGWCSKRIYDGSGDNVWSKFNYLVLKQDPPSEKNKFFGKLFSK